MSKTNDFIAVERNKKRRNKRKTRKQMKRSITSPEDVTSSEPSVDMEHDKSDFRIQMTQIEFIPREYVY